MSKVPTGEFAFISWLRAKTPLLKHVKVGPGDDTAVLETAEGLPLLTTDMLLEGSCFILQEAGAYRVGRKAIAVNLSDIAAMAGKPLAAVVALALPRHSGREIAEQLYEGIRDGAEPFGTAIVGGDTNSWSGPLAISITLFGEATSRGPVLRSGARPGDLIFTTGPLGGSLLGKHLDFTPRIREALALHQAANLHAMIDISDGLAADLHHICTESQCGALLWGDKIPIADAARQKTLLDGREPLYHALHDGEDFELLFTIAPEDRQLFNNSKIDFPIYCIGVITNEGFSIDVGGNVRPLEPEGYVHQFT